MKNPLLVFLLLFAVVLFPGEALANDGSQRNRTSFAFFPYTDCIVAKILQAKIHDHRWLIQIQIEEIVRGTLKKGEKATLISTNAIELRIKESSSTLVSANPTEKEAQLLIKLTGSKQALAFDRQPPESDFERDRFLQFPSPTPVTNLYVQQPDTADLQAWRSAILASSKSVQGSKANLQSYLEQRWTVKRIKDFCRPNTRWIGSVALALYGGKSDWEGKCHANNERQLDGLQVSWRACTYAGIPQLYEIEVINPEKKCNWQLELDNPKLFQWTQDDYLKYRVSVELTRALFAFSQINKESKAEYEDRFRSRTNEELIRDSGNNIRAYKCEFRDGTRLTAKLDNRQNIVQLLLNDRPDPKLNQIYSQCSSNIDKLNSPE